MTAAAWQTVHVAVPQLSCKTRQIGLFRSGAEPAWGFGCPIGIDQEMQVPPTPENGTNDGEQTGETVSPAMEERQIAQQQMDQQAHPRLPLYGIGAVPQKVGQLKRLLDLLEEDLDVPSAPVQFGHGPGTPLQVVGEKDHLDVLPVDFHQRHNAAQSVREGLPGRGPGQFNDFIAQNAKVRARFSHLDHAVVQVVFGSADPVDAAFVQVAQVVKIQVGLVEHYDFTGLQGRAQGVRLAAVVKPGRVNDGALRQKRLQVQAQMALGRRFPAPVLGPIHAVGHQLNGGRIERMDGFAKPPQIASPNPTFGKTRALVHQMFHHRPVQRFRHPTVPHPIGVAQVVPTRWRRPANRFQGTRVHAQGIADIVQPNRVCHLSVQQRNHMAPRSECPTLVVHTEFLGQMENQMAWNQIAQLLENGVRMTCWSVVLVVFHTLRVEDFTAAFQPFLSPAMG